MDTQTLDAQIRSLSITEILVETNAGTFSDHEACRKTGSADAGTYCVYESVGGARRTVNPEAKEAGVGFSRWINTAEMARLRKELTALLAQRRALRAR